ncbi:ABC transporter permease subunit [Sedimentibacter sp. zth1]|uniref:ABC transporter permease subunit n=1 Tax=Sedimentibacter sp. zth1 TaxID=2816908 RepID=UPI001A923565|nr:ABC transporter permease subunit [Sedimentibacter sp. zth1]QSX04721.1 ABC transporter permease subunit [Sedimentibacter sp. zth1]
MDNKSKHKKSGFLKLISNTFKGMFLGNNHVEMSVFEEEKMQSPFRTAVSNFFDRKLSVVALVIFILVFLSCFVLSVVFPIDITFQDTTQQDISPGFNMMKIPKELNGNVKTISGGSTFGVGVDNDGELYTWGKVDKRLQEALNKNNPSQYKFRSASAGQNHILAITENGEAMTWSANRFSLNKIPDLIEGATNIKQVSAGYQYSVVLDEDGFMYIWGNINFLGSLSQYTIPPEIQGNIDKIELSTDNVILLLKDKTVRVLGAETPSNLNCPDLTNIKDIAATDNVACALDYNGKITVWGNPMYNLMDVPADLSTDIVSVQGGRSHFIAIASNGKAYGWGRNNYGQIDIPNSVKKGEIKLANIETGYFQSYGIDANGNVTTWGLKGYLLGSDQYGRDVFTRIMAGGKLTLTVGFVAVCIQVIIGVIVGGFAGFYGGKVDNLLMRFAEIVGAIPFLPLAMTLSVVIGNRLTEQQRVYLIMMLLGFLGWSGLARLVRGQILSEREKEFVLAAKATGIKERVIIFRHILPNVITIVIVNATLSYATSLLTESSLSYLGFGILEPNPTWGNMLFASQSSNTIANLWWRWVFPSIALALSTISINMIGDGLRDAIDPKSNDR